MTSTRVANVSPLWTGTDAKADLLNRFVDLQAFRFKHLSLS